MTAADGPHLDVLELSRRLRAVEPAVRLLPARLMGRVLKHLYQVHGLGWQVPHRHCLVVREKDLLPVVDRVDLDLPPESLSEEVLILIAAPTPEELALLSREAILLRSWRTLFHARVHLALEQQRARGQLTDRDLRERLHQIGPSEVEDIRQVLRQEETLLPPGDDWTVFVEFAAVYLELRHFDQALLPWYFPTLRPFGAIDRLLKEVEGGRLLAATRPEGAPDPNQWAKEVPAADAEEPVRAEEPLPVEPRPEKLGRLLSRAEKARGRGNVVRAALASQRAARWAPSGERDQLRSAARADLDGLAERLQAAVGDVHPEEGAWQQALAPLLEQAAAPGWPVEARLLYDLQKVCFDHERELYAVDLVEWGLSLGRRPLQRPVPCQRAVLLLKHLRSAVGRLKSVRLSTEECWALSSLLVAARKRAQERLRESFRPLVRGTLEEVGMRPGNLPERVAQNKLVEELLDRILERGFLTMGDLRDALSRNRLKLPDLGEEVPAGRKSGWARLPLVGGFLTGLAEFWRGDRLLRANQRLAETLDGVYRRGEIYLRWLQRLSAVFFGTRVGRWLVLYLILPFGGAYLALEGMQHLIH
ncbi:MAG: hypothetical protein JO112_19210, partial [Planctomycetes bacterium]|nr:hypothetical protein [Planctomycetota bacterium]